jgi:hypothetical protein
MPPEVTISVDADTRAMLREDLRWGSFVGEISESDLIGCLDVDGILEGASEVSRIFEQIGWEDEGSQEVALDVGPKLLAWLREQAEELPHDIVCDEANMAHTAAGDEGWLCVGHNRQETLAMDREQIAKDKRKLALVTGMLAQLEPVEAAA